MPPGNSKHLVEHDATETFNTGYTVTDFTHGSDIGCGDGRVTGETVNLGFKFLQEGAHGLCVLKWKYWVIRVLMKLGQSQGSRRDPECGIANGGIPDLAT
jgi:hypothetical protein